MFRIMLILGLLVFVPAVIVFWRTRDRVSSGSAPVSLFRKAIGASTVSQHGDRKTVARIGETPTLPKRRR